MDMEYRVGLEQSKPSKSGRKVPVHTSYYSATLPGRWNAGKTRPEESVCKWNHKSSLGSQGRRFEPREDASAFHVFKLAIMIVQCNVPILMPVESNLCNIVAEFTLIVNHAMWQLVLI